MGRTKKRPLNPRAFAGLDRLKHEVAQELGMTTGGGENGLRRNLERRKYEVASELGLLDKIRTIGWGNMTSRDCGRIGGNLGGHLGGQMVRKMVEYAQAHMEENRIQNPR